MRALKILVVVMGLLLVAGTAALVLAVMARVHHPRPAAAATLGRTTTVALPAGARLGASELSGERILVRVVLPDGGGELLLFDARTGARIATIELHAQAPAP